MTLCIVGFVNSAAGLSLSSDFYAVSTIRVVPYEAPVEEIDCEYSNVHMQDLLVRNMQGNVITETTVSSQVMLEATVVNNCATSDEPMITLFEVRDAAGYTLYLTWQMSTIDSNQKITVGSSWVAPDVPGKYEVRGFYIGNLNNPMILSNVLRYDLMVLPAE